MAKLERLNKKQLVDYCISLGINPKQKTKQILIEEILWKEKNEVKESIKNGQSHELLFSKIEILAKHYSENLKLKIEARKEEMKSDNNAHYLIYNVLGITEKQGQLIDEYQNVGRFLYKYAGSFLEEAASLCFQFNNVEGGKVLIKNTQSKRPKNFEIDFLDGNNAIEIKWRDATTDGDHITKEHTRIKAIESHGYTPIRVMFYYPQRIQAKKVQETLKTVYLGVKGKYFAGESAWRFIVDYTGYDLKEILVKIAKTKMTENENQ